MNWFITIAGLVCTFTTIGHFTVGSKSFLKPMLDTSFDPIAKKVMHCVFHYVSTFLILSSITLLLIGFGVWSGSGMFALVNFIAANFIVFAVWQVILAVTSDIPKGIVKLFQWIFFVLIALFAWLGT